MQSLVSPDVLRARLWYSRDTCVFVASGSVIMEVFPGISMDPDVRFGKPCITGTRIDVATVVRSLVDQTPEQARLFELTDEGMLVPWRDASGSDRSSRA
jgi:hypothetical protein